VTGSTTDPNMASNEVVIPPEVLSLIAARGAVGRQIVSYMGHGHEVPAELAEAGAATFAALEAAVEHLDDAVQSAVWDACIANTRASYEFLGIEIPKSMADEVAEHEAAGWFDEAKGAVDGYSHTYACYPERVVAEGHVEDCDYPECCDGEWDNDLSADAYNKVWRGEVDEFRAAFAHLNADQQREITDYAIETVEQMEKSTGIRVPDLVELGV
jgi:hypothetical protein